MAAHRQRRAGALSKARILRAAGVVALLAACLLALTACIPPVPPLGGLGGGGAAAPPAITVSPVIYVVGQDGTLTVYPTPDSQGGGDAPPAATPAPAPAGADPWLMLRIPPEGETAPDLETETHPDLAATLREAEGFSPTVYPDPNGLPHIGYGHQLTPAEADALLAADMAEARAGAARVVGEPTWGELDEARRDVLVEMAYMLGESRFAGFQRMLAALRAGDFEAAADEILTSRLDTQVPTRTARLAAVMREGGAG